MVNGRRRSLWGEQDAIAILDCGWRPRISSSFRSLPRSRLPLSKKPKSSEQRRLSVLGLCHFLSVHVARAYTSRLKQGCTAICISDRQCRWRAHDAVSWLQWDRNRHSRGRRPGICPFELNPALGTALSNERCIADGPTDVAACGRTGYTLESHPMFRSV